MDESENETAGRGMIANREIKEGDELFTLPIDLLLTKDAAKKVGVVFPPLRCVCKSVRACAHFGQNCLPPL